MEKINVIDKDNYFPEKNQTNSLSFDFFLVSLGKKELKFYHEACFSSLLQYETTPKFGIEGDRVKFANLRRMV